MCAKLGSNRLNTVVLRASFILPIKIGNFLGKKSIKTRGFTYLPLKDQKPKLICLSEFWGSFIEIGEMACSRPARSPVPELSFLPAPYRG